MRFEQLTKFTFPRTLRSLSFSILTAYTISNCFTLSALANPITYTVPSENQSGSFNGEMPIKKIGSLLLPKAVVQFKGTDVNVLAVPEWLFDRNVVLSGTLVNVQIDVQDKVSTLRGLVYFSDGMWLNNLASQKATDVIDTISGERWHGNIRARLDNAFAFKPMAGAMQKISFTEIRNINSPRAYVFSAPCTAGKIVPATATASTQNTSMQLEASNISFSPTFAHGFATRTASVPKSTLAGSEQGITKTQLSTMIGMNVFTELAPAIAIPLALNPGTRSQAQREINLYNSEILRSQGVPVPINYNGHGVP